MSARSAVAYRSRSRSRRCRSPLIVLRTSAGPSSAPKRAPVRLDDGQRVLSLEAAFEIEREEEEEALGQAERRRGLPEEPRPAARSRAGARTPACPSLPRSPSGRNRFRPRPRSRAPTRRGTAPGTWRPPTTRCRSNGGHGRTPGPTSYVKRGQLVGIDADDVDVVNRFAAASKSCA